jgi:hypothetical protein
VLEDNIVSSDNYFLRPQDVIVVAPLKARNVSQYFSSTNSFFSIITGQPPWLRPSCCCANG